ncbi:hypothetical protein BLA15945_04905 [Burkholderia lata]|uniref:Uncharacterized protein n=1 Tax=Burkholderia lata (strain ATCC 17760 / DSM 23089 / LMG 22485 / NCIMB 9086 / R18194 / 383) TaxID=482957 RepID=A0A6P2P0X5_BURL3|nr:hypothetical protein BLA15945_04905 [Burkholderia lata]
MGPLAATHGKRVQRMLPGSAGCRTVAARGANVLWRIVHSRLSRTGAARDHRHTRRPARVDEAATGPAVMLTTGTTIR